MSATATATATANTIIADLARGDGATVDRLRALYLLADVCADQLDDDTRDDLWTALAQACDDLGVDVADVACP